MGLQYVKNIAEMNAANRLFYKRVKAAQTRILSRMAQVNEEASEKFAAGPNNIYSFTGELISTIELKPHGALKFQVICSAPHAFEIEEGLKEAEFRSYEEYPKLRPWVTDKFGWAPKEGITVGGKGSVIHPSGLHFMLKGFNLVYENADSLISLELNKLGC